jgi:hypothetical protein
LESVISESKRRAYVTGKKSVQRREYTPNH